MSDPTEEDVLDRGEFRQALDRGSYYTCRCRELGTRCEGCQAVRRLRAHDAALREQNEWLREALSELHAAAGGALRAMYNEWHSAPKRDMVDEYKDLKAASDSARQVLEAIDD